MQKDRRFRERCYSHGNGPYCAKHRACFHTFRAATAPTQRSGGLHHLRRWAKNTTLMRMLREKLKPLGCTLLDSSALGLPVEAKEAAAFALLAYYTWHRRPANVPSATGAKHPAILGQITYV